ncbi:hypothetical protein D8674_014321 [Pyrus ussuriensis x Pyrus communis]|uniref:3-hydroxyisobutyrate dehydrogenase-like NAD-binding domain-containing protein n=1 Tax=Pyrus ussuriensis x Pyrus communis TaxID=2448454 RepID=A0A5N5GXK9_9ROSA|nr:hypothetical protein D8674_014321 [Pyrus ussuriensis x Pyrus communis]
MNSLRLLWIFHFCFEALEEQYIKLGKLKQLGVPVLYGVVHSSLSSAQIFILSGLDVGLFLDAIKVGAAGSRSTDLYGSQILKRDFEPGFYVSHFVKDLGICLKESLAQQLYPSLKAHGEGNL